MYLSVIRIRLLCRSNWFSKMHYISALTCRSDLEAVISGILDNISSSASTHKPISIFIDAANFTKDNEGNSEKSMSFEDFKSWCHLVPCARKFLASLLKPSSSTNFSTATYCLPIYHHLHA